MSKGKSLEGDSSREKEEEFNFLANCSTRFGLWLVLYSSGKESPLTIWDFGFEDSDSFASFSDLEEDDFFLLSLSVLRAIFCFFVENRFSLYLLLKVKLKPLLSKTQKLQATPALRVFLSNIYLSYNLRGRQ